LLKKRRRAGVAAFEFDSEIKRLEGKIKWNVFYFPYPAAEHFGVSGNIPVRITVDGHEFEHMLLPSKNGHYLVYNEFIKRAVGTEFGESVHVTLEKDESERTLKIPEYISEALTNGGVMEHFLKQPNYYKRELINHIEIAKKEETKTNRLNALIKRLGDGNA
jgi:hypothetical protein